MRAATLVKGTNVTNGPKCNKVLNVATFGPKCNEGPKCNNNWS